MDCAVLDLETTDLSAVGGGFILCAVVKPLRQKPVVFRYDEMRCRPAKEKKLVEAVVAEMSKYQLWIGHNRHAIGDDRLTRISSRQHLLRQG